jgi:hypothetical protein
VTAPPTTAKRATIASTIHASSTTVTAVARYSEP